MSPPKQNQAESSINAQHSVRHEQRHRGAVGVGVGIEPYYQDGSVTIYCGDCRDILPWLPKVDLVLTDPPYGIALDTDNSRFSVGTAGNMAKRGNGIGSANGKPIIGDGAPFDPSFLMEYGKHRIIFGWNHFANKLPPGSCLVWIKRNDDAFGTFLSDAELAWMSKGHGVYCRRDLSNNAIANERVHPTQKPVTLMQWCMSFFTGATYILDPFMGSGTTLRAAKDLGRKAIGIEIEERYCEIAAKRLAQEVFDFGEAA
jgi:site-specific DNA-methyltransferase (adenine-specific)